MRINTKKFSIVDINDSKVIHFHKGVLGFENLKSFTLLRDDDLDPFLFLQSIEDEDVALTIINPFEIVDDYSPDVSDLVCSELQMEENSEMLIMNVVVIPSDVSKMTANMMSPIIINATKRVGLQVILSDDNYSLRYPIFEALKKRSERLSAGGA